MDNEEDKPVAQRFRVVQMLECAPALKDGVKPAAVLQFACGELIEPPMLISRWDARRLAFHLLEALTTHGDELATRFFTEWVHRRRAAMPDWREEGDPAAPPFPSPPPEPPKKRRRKK